MPYRLRATGTNACISCLLGANLPCMFLDHVEYLRYSKAELLLAVTSQQC